jgi:hypothetical protein
MDIIQSTELDKIEQVVLLQYIQQYGKMVHYIWKLRMENIRENQIKKLL